MALDVEQVKYMNVWVYVETEEKSLPAGSSPTIHATINAVFVSP
ncbi:hypothetical protein PanWU01x14_170960 [Parasponia andersonii]|uniref:Uncharacterized protein n=1 Tax=Parasponia andersonii TaxID=3476 RepID=A0A2P5CA09_PARAD|nr:hypothetical protein PanWU01x14_170960 [Parasponia andersonii]